MKTRPRSNSSPLLAGAVASAVFCAATVSAAPPDAPGAAARGLMQNRGPAAQAELPDHAKAGSALTGDLDTSALNGRSLSLSLTDGRTIEARVQRIVEDDSAGQKSWVGTAEGMPGSMLVVTTYKGVTTGFLTYGSETWELLPAQGGKHLLFQVDESTIPTDEPEMFPDDVELDTMSGTGDFGTAGATTNAGGGEVHDILIVYTPAAVGSNGVEVLESRIQNAVVAANQAYQNSNVNITLNLVGMQQVNYTESGDIVASLYDLQGTSDGKMDSVHRLRDSLGADIVSLISMDTNACGVAWTMRSESSSFASSAFNVVKKSCLSQHSLAHEIGHNQGNMHNRENSSRGGAFPYSYGFRRCNTDDGTGFRTVMSYGCSGAPRVTQFSNPSINYNGYATGIAYESNPDNSSENARSMNNTADTVAAFRGGSTGGGGDPTVPTAPSSLSASANSSSRVTVSWSDNSDNETGFKLERSDNGVNFAEIATLGADTTGFTDGSVAPNTTYYYRVRAYNSAGNSGYSNVNSATTLDATPPPAAPTSIGAANNGDGSATVSWADASSNETGFEIRRETWDERRSRWTGATTVGSVPAGVTSMVDQSDNGTFRYHVRAVNSGGASSYAGPADTTVTGGSSKGGKGGGGGGGGGKGRGKK